MKIWLDDMRDAPDETWIVVRSASECIKTLAGVMNVEELSLDHDLGDDEDGTGYTVVVVLESWAYNGATEHIPDKIGIHSANPVGRKNMQAAIDSIERIRNAGT